LATDILESRTRRTVLPAADAQDLKLEMLKALNPVAGSPRWVSRVFPAQPPPIAWRLMRPIAQHLTRQGVYNFTPPLARAELIYCCRSGLAATTLG